ncbi:MAG TPA: hypothetical protein PKB00_15110, partial [Microthrixaceae bacterium]|nr:hypothetical protein [Microthrixaceae bacterium]
MLTAAAGALWPELAPLLRSLGIAHPTQVVRVLGSLVLLGGAAALSVEAVRSGGRRRIGLGLVAAGAGIL